MSDRSSRVSLVVPLHNASVYTRIFLLALREVLPGEPEVEVVLVDNGSTDDTPAVLAELAAAHRVVSLDRNHDFAGGCNRGAGAARGELLFFLNNDMVPTRGFVSAAVASLDGDAGLAAVGSRLLFPDGRIQHAGLAFDEHGYPRHTYLLFPGDHPAAARPREVQALTGAALLVRRADFEAVGGFDEAYRNSFEDVDLCLRLRERGRRILYCPSSVLYHFGSGSTGRHDWDEENFRRLHARWHGRVDADPEGLRPDPGEDGADPRPLPSMTPEVRALLAEARRDAQASRTERRALEVRLHAALANVAPSPEPRVLWLDCPDSVAEKSGFTARVHVRPGTRSDSPLVLSGYWAGEGVLPPPRTLDLPSPLGSVVEAALPLEAPEALGTYELRVCLPGGESEAPPGWTKSVRVLPLYGATYRAQVASSLVAGEATVVSVRLGNAGIVPWEGSGFRLSYHWRSLDDGNPTVRDGWRIYIHHPVLSGESTWVRARVLAPPLPGRYALEWDMVHEGVAWFSDLGVPVLSHVVDIVAP